MTKIKESQFKWITSEHPDLTAFIAVDKQLRLYFNVGAQNKLKKTREVYVGYDYANRRLIVADPEIVRPANVKPHRIDKRGYASARPFIRAVGLHMRDLPVRYTYLGKDHSVNGAHVFGLDGEAGEDGAL